VHLRVTRAFTDLGLSHIVEESEEREVSLFVRQRGYQRARRFNVKRPIQAGVDIAQGLPDSVELVVSPFVHGGELLHRKSDFAHGEVIEKVDGKFI